MNVTSNHSLSVKERNMREGRNDSSKTNAIGEGKKHAEIYSPLLLVGRHVNLKLVIHNGGNVINLTLGIKQMRGKYWEVFGIVEIGLPVSNWKHNVDDHKVADGNIDNGEEGADEGAVEVRGDDGPVEREGAEAEAAHARAELLGSDGAGIHPADPGDGRQSWEEIAWNYVPGEAAY